MTAPAAPLTPSDFVGFGALALSVISLGWQAVNQFRGRHRVRVEVGYTITPRHVEGGLLNEKVTTVTIRNTGAGAGIDSVRLEMKVLPPTGFQAQSTAVQELEGVSPTDVGRILTEGAQRRLLQDGEIYVLAYRVSVFGFSGLDVPRDVRAVVLLTSGQEVKSNYFKLTPDLLVPPLLGDARNSA